MVGESGDLDHESSLVHVAFLSPAIKTYLPFRQLNFISSSLALWRTLNPTQQPRLSFANKPDQNFAAALCVCYAQPSKPQSLDLPRFQQCNSTCHNDQERSIPPSFRSNESFLRHLLLLPPFLPLESQLAAAAPSPQTGRTRKQVSKLVSCACSEEVLLAVHVIWAVAELVGLLVR